MAEKTQLSARGTALDIKAAHISRLASDVADERPPTMSLNNTQELKQSKTSVTEEGGKQQENPEEIGLIKCP